MTGDDQVYLIEHIRRNSLMKWTSVPDSIDFFDQTGVDTGVGILCLQLLA